MSNYEEFASWVTDDHAQVYDYLERTGEVRIVDKDTGEALYLTATDIKRLIQCVERYEQVSVSTELVKERK